MKDFLKQSKDGKMEDDIELLKVNRWWNNRDTMAKASGYKIVDRDLYKRSYTQDILLDILGSGIVLILGFLIGMAKCGVC
jgi:hypothetical protein